MGIFWILIALTGSKTPSLKGERRERCRGGAGRVRSLFKLQCDRGHALNFLGSDRGGEGELLRGGREEAGDASPYVRPPHQWPLRLRPPPNQPLNAACHRPAIDLQMHGHNEGQVTGIRANYGDEVAWSALVPARLQRAHIVLYMTWHICSTEEFRSHLQS